MAPTKSQLNAQHCRDFVSATHSTPYDAIDPSHAKLPPAFVACIIGGRGAAGAGLAKAYARAGASGLILAARTLPALEETANEVRSINPTTKVTTAECDITSESNVESLAHTIESKFAGRLDVVVVNSGYTGPMTSDVVKESPKDYQNAFNVNTIGVFYAAHYLLPLLVATNSPAMSFLAISSMSAPTVSGPITHTHYCVSKAAQARLIEMINEQYAENGLFCASIHPGGLKSEFSRDAPEWLAKYLTDSPDLVGAFCVWLSTSSGSERRRRALNGRFLSCKWDVAELEARFDEIVEKDLLRFRIAVE
ncbi:hypothetical protein N7532_008946 [Penicillium argentinense]|uniref:NAD(P)-binding protein n=1 Tax=Penicillium argentinense TaxID=1131581 RepID=A0A9W9EYF4_9EURO|nr:uncharacterized protein N7532_008946 [Penicillium argentinense]KAJ5090262.1 hypothetical protein N7532_008946 [Penicillium argentinense]